MFERASKIGRGFSHDKDRSGIPHNSGNTSSTSGSCCFSRQMASQSSCVVMPRARQPRPVNRSALSFSRNRSGTCSDMVLPPVCRAQDSQDGEGIARSVVRGCLFHVQPMLTPVDVSSASNASMRTYFGVSDRSAQQASPQNPREVATTVSIRYHWWHVRSHAHFVRHRTGRPTGC